MFLSGAITCPGRTAIVRGPQRLSVPVVLLTRGDNWTYAVVESSVRDGAGLGFVQLRWGVAVTRSGCGDGFLTAFPPLLRWCLAPLRCHLAGNVPLDTVDAKHPARLFMAGLATRQFNLEPLPCDSSPQHYRAGSNGRVRATRRMRRP